MSMRFTQAELAAAIAGAARNPEETPNSITTSELARALPCSQLKARTMLRDAMDAGVVRPQYVTRITPHGIARSYEGYVLVDRGEAS